MILKPALLDIRRIETTLLIRLIRPPIFRGPGLLPHQALLLLHCTQLLQFLDTLSLKTVRTYRSTMMET